MIGEINEREQSGVLVSCEKTWLGLVVAGDMAGLDDLRSISSGGRWMSCLLSDRTSSCHLHSFDFCIANHGCNLKGRKAAGLALGEEMTFSTHADFSDDQLKELAKHLAEKRVELLDTLRLLDQQIAAKEDCSLGDAVEAASLQEARARASGIADQHKYTLSEIDLALRRMDLGRYGISESSGDPIAYERLLLIPWARNGIAE